MWGQYKPGRIEACFAISLGLFAVAKLWGSSILAELVTLLALIVFGGVLAVKLVRFFGAKLLWRVRNRIIVLYLLTAVIPGMLLVNLMWESTRYLAGQTAVYMVHSELERRLAIMEGVARSVLRTPEPNRSAMLDRIGMFYGERFPGIQVLTGDKEAGPDTRGVVAKAGLLYVWARVSGSGDSVTVATPLTKKWLAGLSPGLGEVSIVHFPGGETTPGQKPLRIRTHEAGNGEDDELPTVPPPTGRFDAELLWGSKIPVALWESPRQSITGLLAVHSRMSALMQILLSLRTESPIPSVLVVLAISLAMLELISLILGISMTRTITEAVHNLYEGTGRVMQGDFAHRIQVRGNEQIAELSRSFNRMTENLEHLVEVAKEKERMQAELEIARGVQQQLFPRQAPVIQGLEVSALCKPALSVSGDYYDFQPLPDGKFALSIGDVAGKGMSAALLMAMLQSSLRILLHGSVEMAAANGQSSTVISTSRLVSRLNQQLYADTTPEKYTTFFLSIYDESTGTLTYTNAGHLQPLLIRAGKSTRCDVNGMIVGAFASASYDESSLQLLPGDLLIGYTDGITEPENEFGEMFGEARLVETVAKSAHMSLDHVIHTVMEEVHRFTGSPELQDDMTMLVARRSA